MKPRTLINILVILFFVLGTATLIDQFFKQRSSLGEVQPNTLCLNYLDANISQTLITDNDHNPLLRPLIDRYNALSEEEKQDKEKYSYHNVVKQFCGFPEGAQFDKFIWVITDGWPRAFADELFDFFKSNSAGFGSNVPGLKLSHAIYISWFTGEPSVKHWISREMSTYNLWDALFAAGYQIDYLGKELSMMTILGPERVKQFNSTQFIDEKEATSVHSGLFPNLNGILNSTRDNEKSLVAFSALYDTWMHNKGFQHPEVKNLLNKLIENLKRIKAWIDENPDYLLIISTDHGVDGFGNLLHGHTMENNNGFMLFYNPTLPTINERVVDVVDFAPTISGYLKGVDIPPTSVGKTQTKYPSETSAVASSMMLKQNLLELYALSQWEPSSIDPKARLIAESFFDDMDSETKLYSMKEVNDMVNALKQKLYAVSGLSMATFLYNLFAGLGVLYWILSRLNTAFFAYIRSNQYPAALSHFIWFVLIYTPALVSAWSLGTWHIDHGLGYSPIRAAQIMSPTLMFLILQRAYTQEQSFTMNLMQNELINAMFLALSIITPREILVKVTNGIPLVVVYMITSWCIAKVYNTTPVAAIGTLASLRDSIDQKFGYGANAGQKHSNLGDEKHAKEHAFYQVILGLMFTFELTSDWKWAYFILGFHVIAFVIYVSLIFAFGSALTKVKSNVSRVFIPVSLMIFFLLHRSTLNRLQILLVNYQMLYLVLPSMKKLFKKIDELQPSIGSLDKSHVGAVELLFQCCLMLIFNQALFHFSVFFGNTFDVNVDPFTGRVGRLTFDVFPLLSAFLMAFAKYGIFLLLAVFLYYVYGTTQQKSSKIYYAPVAAILLTFSTLNVIFHEMLWRYMMPLQIIDMLVSSASWGVIGILYVGIDLLKSFKPRGRLILPSSKGH